jgi:TPP-dependent trihydroxycyclohexane-1,2-dione (THcHDO) dehydratase
MSKIFLLSMIVGMMAIAETGPTMEDCKAARDFLVHRYGRNLFNGVGITGSPAKPKLACAVRVLFENETNLNAFVTAQESLEESPDFVIVNGIKVEVLREIVGKIIIRGHR